MATHKSAAVAARQRVADHLQEQIEALTSAVERGLKAVQDASTIETEKQELLTRFAVREQQAQDNLGMAVDELRSLGKNKTEIADLLGIDAKSIRSKRSASAPRAESTAPTMPEPTMTT